MKNQLLKLSILLLTLALAKGSMGLAQIPSTTWATTVTATGQEAITALATDNIGNLYMTGNMTGAMSFGNITLSPTPSEYSATDGFIVKYSSDGNVLWGKKIGGTGWEEILNVTADANGNTYICGTFTSPTLVIDAITLVNGNTAPIDNTSLFYAKLSPDGTAIWARTANSTAYDKPTKITIDNTGNIIISGFFHSNSLVFSNGIGIVNTSTDSGRADGFILKCDNNGIPVWSRVVPGTLDEDVADVATDTFGNIYAAGNTSSPVITVEGIGYPNESSPMRNIFIMKYDVQGSLLWVRVEDGEYDDLANDLTVDSNNNVYMAASFWSPYLDFDGIPVTGGDWNNILLVKYTPVGSVVWAHTSTGPYAYDSSNFVFCDAQDLLYFGGMFEREIALGNNITLQTAPENNLDTYVAQMSSEGLVKWAKQAGGVSLDRIDAGTLGPDGGIYIAGLTISGTIDFGETSLTGITGNDFFVAKIGGASLSTPSRTSNISIFPNPAEDFIMVPESLSNPASFTITDTSGRIIASGIPLNKKIDVAWLPQGIYFLNIDNTRSKFIKK